MAIATKTPRQINADRKARGLPPLNFKLIKKIIKRIETKPETLAQQVWYEKAKSFNNGIEKAGPEEGHQRPVPLCGSVECIAGEAIICNSSSVVAGIRQLQIFNETGEVLLAAKNLLGLVGNEINLFDGDANAWIEPFRSQFRNAKTYKGEARAAVNYLKFILRTGKVWSSKGRRRYGQTD